MAERFAEVDLSGCQEQPYKWGIERSAFVADTARIDICAIGPGTKVWDFAHICNRAVVGANCVLGQNVYVGPGVRIGDGCKVQNNVSVYAGVTLEEDVFLGPSCVFTNVKTPRAFIDRMDELAPTLVKRGATVGANATILCGLTIGEYAMVGAGAVVTHDVPAHGVVVGNPATLYGFACRCGAMLQTFPANWVTNLVGERRLVPLERGMMVNCRECREEYSVDALLGGEVQ